MQHKDKRRRRLITEARLSFVHLHARETDEKTASELYRRKLSFCIHRFVPSCDDTKTVQQTKTNDETVSVLNTTGIGDRISRPGI